MSNTIEQHPPVKACKHGPAYWLTMNRPNANNALTVEMAKTLIAGIDRAEKDPTTSVIVLTGAGRNFCCGADLVQFQKFRRISEPRPDFLDVMSLLNHRLRDCAKPTIAAVNGLACAGGLELMLCCDLAIAVEEAKLGDAHVNFAAFPGGGGASVLVRRLGMARTKQLLFTGELRPARVWESWGLLNEVVANQAELIECAQQFAERIAMKSPLILVELKTLANRSENCFRDTGLRDEISTLRKLCKSNDMEEGFSAFFEKRTPRFKGE